MPLPGSALRPYCRLLLKISLPTAWRRKFSTAVSYANCFAIRLGTVKGILLQAALFGLMHNALYLLAGLQVGLWYHTLMFLFTGMAALLLGWLNAKNL